MRNKVVSVWTWRRGIWCQVISWSWALWIDRLIDQTRKTEVQRCGLPPHGVQGHMPRRGDEMTPLFFTTHNEIHDVDDMIFVTFNGLLQVQRWIKLITCCTMRLSLQFEKNPFCILCSTQKKCHRRNVSTFSRSSKQHVYLRKESEQLFTRMPRISRTVWRWMSLLTFQKKKEKGHYYLLLLSLPKKKGGAKGLFGEVKGLPKGRGWRALPNVGGVNPPDNGSSPQKGGWNHPPPKKKGRGEGPLSPLSLSSTPPLPPPKKRRGWIPPLLPPPLWPGLLGFIWQTQNDGQNWIRKPNSLRASGWPGPT